ncbi:MAG: adenylate/guanylate cyclase domain-containing protein [Pirellulaceae bacterium]|nr:adenylate/guanylate cyclase domain-containing protein [Planctomycetales bacterium]
MPSFQVAIASPDFGELVVPFDSQIELGRQMRGESPPLSVVEGTIRRVIVAPLGRKSVSRRHFELAPESLTSVEIRNVSEKRSLEIAGFGKLRSGEVHSCEVPIRIEVDNLGFEVTERSLFDWNDDQVEVRALNHMTLTPSAFADPFSRPISRSIEGDEGLLGSKQLIEWLSIAMGVLQSAATSPDFLTQSARAVVEIVDLDRAAALTFDGDGWQVAAMYEREPLGESWGPSQTMLRKLRQERRTLRQMPVRTLANASLVGIEAVVVAPILSHHGRIIGALYGERRQTGSSSGQPQISEVEAMLVEVLACGVAAGVARVEKERAAMQAQVQFEQFFTPELARNLQSNPRLLEGRNADVSILFCDVRGFSRISERLGSERTMSWISDLMGELSLPVLESNGVLVDYIGDELMAMWGAPDDQPNHAMLACQAAVAMVRNIPKMDARWRDAVGEELRLGIGICSGAAHVGNTGTTKKFKYGPLGNTVNVASRIQGATKFFNVRCLVHEDTAHALDDRFATRRVATVRLLNIRTPVGLYQVVPADSDLSWIAHRPCFDDAMQAFEAADFATAIKAMDAFLTDVPDDGPGRLLKQRIQAAAIANKDALFDPIWELPGK